MKQQCFVTFYSPGTIVAETTTKPIPAWDIQTAKAMARTIKERHGAAPYGFQFITRRRTEQELDSRAMETSPMYFLGGTIETLDQVKARATAADRTLVANMEGNHYDRIITNTNSYRWTQPLRETDIVLDWP
jgi:hypothetical protein